MPEACYTYRTPTERSEGLWSGRSSVAERHLAEVEVAGSSPVARSKFLCGLSYPLASLSGRHCAPPLGACGRMSTGRGDHA